MVIVQIAIVIVGAIMSYFYGRYAREIWIYPLIGPVDKDGNLSLPKGVHQFSREDYCKNWHRHQIWINWLGSALGWAAVFYLVTIRLDSVNQLTDLQWHDGVIALVAVVGIMGYLPSLISRLGALPIGGK